jgi:hypothetical protein
VFFLMLYLTFASNGCFSDFRKLKIGGIQIKNQVNSLLVKHHLFLFLIFGVGMLCTTAFLDAYATNHFQGNRSKISITMSYANDISKPYTVLVDRYQKYTISQSNSWANNNFTRFNLQSYSIDDGPFVSIQRISDGNFTLELATDSNHSITFLATPQFKIITSGTSKVNFWPPSPTNDNWFDEDSDVQIIVPYVLQSDREYTRQQLSGWSSDSSDTFVISRQEYGSFKSPVIHVSSMHKIELEYTRQYYITIISDFGRALGTGWYDSGTIVYASVIPADDILVRHVFTGWQGSVIGNGNQESVNILSDSPKIIVANWFIDYTNVSIIGITIVVVLVSLIIYQKRI